MEESGKFIVFTLKDQYYSTDIGQIVSVEKSQQITELPGTSNFIKGIIDLRDETTPIVDLKERLQLENTRYTDDSRILVAMIDNVQIGLIVDSATDVIDIDDSQIEPSPTVVGKVHKQFLKGVAKLDGKLLIILDLKHVLDMDELNEIREVTNE